MTYDPAVVGRVVDQLLDQNAHLRGCRLVSIDGPAGSGKTTLASAVAERCSTEGLTCRVLHMDDFYRGWTGLDDDLEQRVLAQVLHPLAAGGTARWQQYDWYAGCFDTWHDLPAPDVLVLEGCGSGARAYDPYRSLLVWVEAPPDVRVARGIARDGEQVLPEWRRWMIREQAHYAVQRTPAHADLTIDTSEESS